MQFSILKEETQFFTLLPEDWQESIVPIWQQIKNHATIYILQDDVNSIVAGGIVFSTIIPEIEAFKEEANFWFAKNYLYIGYVWVPENQRNKSYGKLWLQNLQNYNTNQHYWLTIEDKNLRTFYEKVGFSYVKTISYDDVEEELLVC